MTYYRVHPENWDNGWYYDYKFKQAYPMIDRNKIYKCVSILESESDDTVLRVIINEETDEYVYIPSRAMIPIEIVRNNIINQILNENREK